MSSSGWRTVRPALAAAPTTGSGDVSAVDVERARAACRSCVAQDDNPPNTRGDVKRTTLERVARAPGGSGRRQALPHRSDRYAEAARGKRAFSSRLRCAAPPKPVSRQAALRSL